MVSLDDAVIAKIHKGKEVFEVFVDSEKAVELKKGRPYSMENVLAVSEIFKDAKKGERASSSELQKAFGTTDVFQIAEIIVKEGEVQLTTDEKRKMIEEKKKEIADIISKQGVDPKTKIPHPSQRILNAMEQAHVQIDPMKEAKEQVGGILEKLYEILPISIETAEISIKVPMKYAGHTSSSIRGMVTIKKEEWKSDAWYAVIEVPAGTKSHILDKLNELTGGNVETSEINR